MFKYHRNLLPSFFDDLFVRNSVIHTHNTRQQYLLHVPLVRSMPLSRTVRVSGVYLYNYFGTRIDMNVSYETYKRHLKKLVLGSTDISSICSFL